MARSPRYRKPTYNEHFIPLEPLDVNRIKSFDDLLTAMSKTAFAGRQTGEAADILLTMVTDPDCFVVGTFSGAMSVAKMGLVIVEMIERKMLQAVVSTGALMAHGLIEGLGMTHFKYDGQMDDRTLYYHGYDRVYDTLELERNFENLGEIVQTVFADANPEAAYSSARICQLLGTYLLKQTPRSQRAILKSAAVHGVPVYIPAFSDSELGMDFAIVNRYRQQHGLKTLTHDPLIDLEHYAELVLKQKRLGIFTIGGGVPRNWAQQVCPFLHNIRFLFRDKSDEKKYFADKNDSHHKLFQYGVRICPESANWGGLSGCTYAEGTSWGKFVPAQEGGRFAEIVTEATAVWPLLIKGVLERMKKRRLTVARKQTVTLPIR